MLWTREASESEDYGAFILLNLFSQNYLEIWNNLQTILPALSSKTTWKSEQS